MLHRAIDNYTDSHPATKQAKEFFRQHYRLYSGAFIDVVYDHFLANDEDEFSEKSLLDFSIQVYSILDHYKKWFPVIFARMFPYMRQQNWLFNYRTRWGTGKSMGGLVLRAAYLTESETAYRLFEEHYQPLKDCYRQFWNDVKPFARQKLENLLSGDTYL